MTSLQMQYLILMRFVTWPFPFADWYIVHVFCVFPLSKGIQHIFPFDAAVYRHAVLHYNIILKKKTCIKT